LSPWSNIVPRTDVRNKCKYIILYAIKLAFIGDGEIRAISSKD
jgi:hypothetical protein